MKKLLVVTGLVLSSMMSYGQKLTGNLFQVTLTSGIGEKIPMKFSINNEDLKNIKLTEAYRYHVKNYLEKGMVPMVSFLNDGTVVGNLKGKWEFENQTSYTPLKNGNGTIYLSDDNEVVFVIPCKAQNGYGNYVVSKVYYKTKVVNGKEIASVLVLN
jgi:hypothetical protein